MEAIEVALTASYTLVVLAASLLGLAGVVALRSSGRSAFAPFGSCLFFLCFLVEAVCAVSAMLCNSSTWLVFGAVLAAMAVGATLDSGRPRSLPAC